MNNSIPQINLINQGELIFNDKIISGIIKDFPEVLQNIRPNQNLFLNVVIDNEMLVMSDVKATIKLGGMKNVVVDLNLDKSLSLPKNVENEIFAKVVSNNNGDLKLKLISINNEQPENFAVKDRSQPSVSVKLEVSENNAKKSAVVKNFAEFKPNIETAPVKLEKIIDEMKSSLPLSKPQAERIVKELSNVALKFEVVDLAKAEPSEDLAVHLKNVIETNLRKPGLGIETDMGKIAEQIKVSLETLKDVFVKANVDRAVDGKTFIIKTPMGEVLLNSDVKVALDKDLFLTLKEVVVLENKAKPLPLREVITETLKNINSKLAEAVAAKIPDLSTPKFVSNFISYTKAAITKDLSAWLGKEVVEEISSRGIEGREAVSRLGNMISANTREAGPWRFVEVPFMIDSNLKSIKIAVKKRHDDENKRNKNKEAGYRFIIDTAFTALGEMQFDGYAVEKDRKFDLIIRMQNDIGEDLCSHIMRIFNDVLVSIGYAGRIKININESFVKVIEEEQCLADGVYI